MRVRLVIVDFKSVIMNLIILLILIVISRDNIDRKDEKIRNRKVKEDKRNKKDKEGRIRIGIELGFYVSKYERGASNSRPRGANNELATPVKVTTADTVEPLVHLNNHTQSYWNNVVPSNTNYYE